MNKLLLIPGFLLASCVLVMGADDTYGKTPPPHADAVFTSHPPVVDGQWKKNEWVQAKPVFFTTPDGSSPQAASMGETRFLWTASGMYVAFRAIDRTPIQGYFKPGEVLYQEDVFELFIDPAGDHRQYYEIQVNLTGQIYIKNYLLTATPRLTGELRLTQEFLESELWRYDMPKPDGMEVASRYDPKNGEWTLELFLPVSFINRRQNGAPLKAGTWRINLARHDWDRPPNGPTRPPPFMYWAPVLPGHAHVSPTLMGWLELKK